MDDTTYNPDMQTMLRKRADSMFNKVLDEICQDIELKPEHLEIVKSVPVRIASEELEVLLEEAARLKEELAEEKDSPNPDAKRLLERFNHYTGVVTQLEWFIDEAFWFHGGIEHIDRHIGVGCGAEAWEDDSYKMGFEAEIGHAIIRTAGHFREGQFNLHDGVSEFYDKAMHPMSPSEHPINTIGIDSVHSLYLEYAKGWESLEELEEAVDKAAIKATETISDAALAELTRIGLLPGSTDDYLTHLIEVQLLTAFTLIKKKNIEHIEGNTIFEQLTNHVMTLKDMSRDEALPYMRIIAGKTLYDSSIDLSSPKQFIETVVPKLPEYLKQDG